MSETVTIRKGLAVRLLTISDAYAAQKREEAASYAMALGESTATKMMRDVSEWAKEARDELADFVEQGE